MAMQSDQVLRLSSYAGEAKSEGGHQKKLVLT